MPQRGVGSEAEGFAEIRNCARLSGSGLVCCQRAFHIGFFVLKGVLTLWLQLICWWRWMWRCSKGAEWWWQSCDNQYCLSPVTMQTCVSLLCHCQAFKQMLFPSTLLWAHWRWYGPAWMPFMFAVARKSIVFNLYISLWCWSLFTKDAICPYMLLGSYHFARFCCTNMMLCLGGGTCHDHMIIFTFLLNISDPFSGVWPLRLRRHRVIGSYLLPCWRQGMIGWGQGHIRRPVLSEVQYTCCKSNFVILNLKFCFRKFLQIVL